MARGFDQQMDSFVVLQPGGTEHTRRRRTLGNRQLKWSLMRDPIGDDRVARGRQKWANTFRTSLRFADNMGGKANPPAGDLPGQEFLRLPQPAIKLNLEGTVPGINSGTA